MIRNTSYFEDIGFHLKQTLSKATESAKICVAWINWAEYNDLFRKLADKGVSVEIIYNDDYLNQRNFVDPGVGIQMFPVIGRFYNSLMHNKFCVIDNSKVVTGSFNWSRRAREHFENIVIIENDFNLVKSFLHEFEDLKNYFSEHGQQQKICCANKDYSRCSSYSYNLGVLGQESGLYDESLVDVWNICLKNGHINFVGKQYENHLHSYLGLKDVPDREHDLEYDKDAMLSEFEQERKQILILQKYFDESQGHKIHAIGQVVMDNPNEHIKWGEAPTYIVNILWRDMYYRKVIPDALYDSFDDVESIIIRHVNMCKQFMGQIR